MIIKYKNCTRCLTRQPLDNFYIRSDKPHLRTSHCKDCMLRDQRISNARNPERRKTILVNSRINGLAVSLLRGARNRAIKRGIFFDLDLDDIIVPILCPVFGIPLHSTIGSGRRGPSPSSPSIDRVNPKLGYTKDNIRIISHKANTIKSNATILELQQIIQYMESQSNIRQ